MRRETCRVFATVKRGKGLRWNTIEPLELVAQVRFIAEPQLFRDRPIKPAFRDQLPSDAAAPFPSPFPRRLLKNLCKEAFELPQGNRAQGGYRFWLELRLSRQLFPVFTFKEMRIHTRLIKCLSYIRPQKPRFFKNLQDAGKKTEGTGGSWRQGQRSEHGRTRVGKSFGPALAGSVR